MAISILKNGNWSSTIVFTDTIRGEIWEFMAVSIILVLK